MRTIAFRRHTKRKAIAKAKRLMAMFRLDPWAEVSLRHGEFHSCSCNMCCNPRHNPWGNKKSKLTIQELRHG